MTSITKDRVDRRGATSGGGDESLPTVHSGRDSIRITALIPNLPAALSEQIELFMAPDGHAYLRRTQHASLPVLRIGTKTSDAYLRRFVYEQGVQRLVGNLRDVNDRIAAEAELSGDIRDVWYRNAPIPGGVEIDLGDSEGTRVEVTAGRVEIIDDGTATLFYRTPMMNAFPMPTVTGCLERLKKYVNLSDRDCVLLVAWISYTLAHPKVATSGFPILVLSGEQGSGKSFICRLILKLVDPNNIGIQAFPGNTRDLAVAVQSAHLSIFDNVRFVRPLMADALCMTATGGTFAARALFTDKDIAALRLHGALILNGIHTFVDQPDLAQRCLSLHLQSLDESKRRDEASMVREFQVDWPHIFRGLLDLIASVLIHLPSVEPTSPERMIGFSRWLAAMEKVDGAPEGAYQSLYSEALEAGTLDGLLEDPLAAAVLDLAENKTGDCWSGTPAELFEELDCIVGKATSYSADWPRGPIAMSKRLKPLQVALRSQGIDIQWTRGKKRKITITRREGPSDE